MHSTSKGKQGNEMMTPEQRHEFEMLRTAMNTVHQQKEIGLMPAELVAIDHICDAVVSSTRGNLQARAWNRGAVATKQILRDHSEGVKAEFIAAYADLPPMEWR
jgi:hypothetical protein